MNRAFLTGVADRILVITAFLFGAAVAGFPIHAMAIDEGKLLRELPSGTAAQLIGRVTGLSIAGGSGYCTAVIVEVDSKPVLLTAGHCLKGAPWIDSVHLQMKQILSKFFLIHPQYQDKEIYGLHQFFNDLGVIEIGGKTKMVSLGDGAAVRDEHIADWQARNSKKKSVDSENEGTESEGTESEDPEDENSGESGGSSIRNEEFLFVGGAADQTGVSTEFEVVDGALDIDPSNYQLRATKGTLVGVDETQALLFNTKHRICRGDSGGPVFRVNRTAIGDTLRLIGIISGAPEVCNNEKVHVEPASPEILRQVLSGK